MAGWRVSVSWERERTGPLWRAYPWSYGLYVRLYRLCVWVKRPL